MTVTATARASSAAASFPVPRKAHRPRPCCAQSRFDMGETSPLPSLRLRRGTMADADRLAGLMAQPQVYEFLGDGHPVPVEVARDWLAQSDGFFARHGVGMWFLDIDGGSDGSFVSLAPGDDGAELAFALHPTLWGRGHAFRMAMTAMDKGFSNGFEKIWGGVDGANTRSEAALVRCGLRRVGTIEFPLGPGSRYEILRDEWQSGQADLIPIE
ncbi:MAG: GNAT family protein [Mesorhizobium sp.]